MTKVHITLVGGQPAPVYHGIVATKPEKVIYIYSSDSLHVLNSICREIDLPYEKIELDPIEPIKISHCAHTLAEKYKDDEVTLNISSGLKSWSHLFGLVFDKMDNAAVVYMDQNNVLWNYKTMLSQNDFEFDMHALFRLYGNPLENNYKKFLEYTAEDDMAAVKIEQIRNYQIQNNDLGVFNQLVALLDFKNQNILKNSHTGHFELNDKQNCVEWIKKESNCPNEKVLLSLCSKNKGVRKWKIESPHAIGLVFNSGWFEYKVAKLLSSWNKAKEICLNCSFPFRPKLDKNEVDIIVNTGTKILFVECKTQIKNTTDIDKFRSVVKTYGGTGSKGLFVTQAKMTDIAKKKCEENGILSFSLEDGLCGLPVDKALFLCLDKELFNINTR